MMKFVKNNLSLINTQKKADDRLKAKKVTDDKQRETSSEKETISKDSEEQRHKYRQ